MLDGAKRPSAAELGERVVRLGREGLGRAEIAAALGVGLEQLARMEARAPRLAAAMRRAADAELAWWEAQPREALAAGARFNMSAWAAAMRWRFGAPEAAAGAGAAADARDDAPAPPRTIYILPDNGKERRAPDGTPMTPELRRAHTLAPVTDKIERLERELASWREKLREVEAWFDENDEDDDDDDWDADEEGDGEDEDGWEDWDGEDDDDDSSEEDEIDDDEGDEHDANDDGGAGDPLPLAPVGRVASPVGGGEGASVAGVSEGCERTVPAGLAGAAAWRAQPDLGAGGAYDPAELRG